MHLAHYAVLRFTPDPVRDEAINVGIVVLAPHGALFRTQPAALERMYRADPGIARETVEGLQGFMDALVSRAAPRFTPFGVELVEPWKPDFLDALRDRLPERFSLGQRLYLDLPDDRRETVETAVDELVTRLAAPLPHEANVAGYSAPRPVGG